MSRIEHIHSPASTETLTAFIDYANAMHQMTDAESAELAARYPYGDDRFIDVAERAEVLVYTSGRVTPDHQVVGVDDQDLADLSILTALDDTAVVLALAILAQDLLPAGDFAVLTEWASQPQSVPVPDRTGPDRTELDRTVPAAAKVSEQPAPATAAASRSTGSGRWRRVGAFTAVGLIPPVLFLVAFLSYQHLALALMLLPLVIVLPVTAARLSRSRRGQLVVPRQQGRSS